MPDSNAVVAADVGTPPTAHLRTTALFVAGATEAGTTAGRAPCDPVGGCSALGCQDSIILTILHSLMDADKLTGRLCPEVLTEPIRWQTKAKLSQQTPPGRTGLEFVCHLGSNAESLFLLDTQGVR